MAEFAPPLLELLEANREWAAKIKSEDPDFFINSAQGQAPKVIHFSYSTGGNLMSMTGIMDWMRGLAGP